MLFYLEILNYKEKLAKVARDELNCDFVRTLELMPFCLEETRRYILHRLTQAGLREPLPFKDQTIERIYEMSQGNPEEINKSSTEFMMEELDRQRTEVTPSFMQVYQTHLIGAGVIVAVLAVIGFGFSKKQHLKKWFLKHKIHRV